MLIKLLVIFVIQFHLQFSTGLKLTPPDLSTEESCTVVHPDPSVNMTWLTSVDHWYVHVMSRQAVYENLHFLIPEEEFASLTDEVVKNSCHMATQLAPLPNTFKLYGLNEKFFELEVSFPKYRKGVIDLASTGPDPQHVVTAYVILTDNKTYYVGLQIFPDGSRGFYVVSPFNTIAAEEMDKIKKVIESHNFPKDSFYTLGADCANNDFLNSIKKELSLS